MFDFRFTARNTGQFQILYINFILRRYIIQVVELKAKAARISYNNIMYLTGRFFIVLTPRCGVYDIVAVKRQMTSPALAASSARFVRLPVYLAFRIVTTELVEAGLFAQ